MLIRNITVTILALAVLVGGCSSTRAYRSDVPANVTMTANVSGSALSPVSVHVHIYAVGRDCKAAYRGTLDLDSSRKAVGIPVGKPSYLVFEFPRFSLLPLATTNTSFETLLTPRPGYRYEVEASYANDIYGATLYERPANSGARREIPTMQLTTCGL